MEIYEILKSSGKDLYPEDLDFFETELATGGPYDETYRMKCRNLIEEIRRWQAGDDATEEEPVHKRANKNVSVEILISQAAPMEANPAANLSREEILFRDIRMLRERPSYKTNFKKFVTEQDVIDSAFVEKHFSFFKAWEINAILSVKQMDEEFLEKYFGVLDNDKIARYQLFSENFFMKHFAQLDHTIVLQRGKNQWRKKEKRSKQLDVFLRLKGVKI